MTLLESLLAVAGKTTASVISGLGGNWIKRQWAARKAARGGVGAQDLSLESLVRIELRRLAGSASIPTNLPKHYFHDWLLRAGQEQRFAEVLVAQAGGAPAPPHSRRELAVLWAEVTGDAATSADGAVEFAVSHLSNVISATPAGTQALQTALQMRIASRQEALRQTAPELLPIDELMRRARTAARHLFTAGSRNWGLPAEVVALSLDRRSGPKLEERVPSSFEEMLSLADGGGRHVVFGDGGVGKTTLLLQLCSRLLTAGARVPLFFDAASWARTNKGLLEYLSSREQAMAGLPPAALAKLAAEGCLTLFVNGWNEIAAEFRGRCLAEMADLDATYSRIGIVVSTRGPTDFPREKGTQYLEVLGLTWKEQVEVVRSRLPEDAAERLLSLLARQSDLRRAARSPLILEGVLAKGASGDTSAVSILDLLGAAVEKFEVNPQRASALVTPPLEGHFRTYLQQLAFELTNSLSTVCARDDALRALATAGGELYAKGVLGAPARASEVLNALVSHHLLQVDDEGIRFAHQRFQEYFAALKVLADCAPESTPRSVLKEVVRGSGWEEVLRLVAQTMRYAGQPERKVVLLCEALAVDLGLACDLVGQSLFERSDNADVYDTCLQKIEALAASPLPEVKKLATCLQIATGWPVFAQQLWPLLEHENQQTRLTTYRLSQLGITMRQLGADAEERISAWPKNLRAEFIHEVAENSDNFDHVEQVALTASDDEVRAAAISALLWNYPASESGLRAWSQAPEALQVALLSEVATALDRAPEPVFVSEILGRFAESLEGKDQLHFVREFPSRAGSKAVQPLLDVLKANDSSPHYRSDVLEVALRLAPIEVRNLAHELTVERRDIPEWVWSVLEEEPEGTLAELREALKEKLDSGVWNTTDPHGVGKLATVELAQRVVDAWFEAEQIRAEGVSTDDGKAQHLRQALMAVEGRVLVQAIASSAGRYVYRQGIDAIQLLLQRAERQTSRIPLERDWQPTVAEVQKVVQAFERMLEPERDRQGALQAYLSALCARAGAPDFKPFILDTLAKQLELWSAYRKEIAALPRSSPRPANPYYGQYVTTAVAACGYSVVQEVLALATHPEAAELVPEILVRIVSQPWYESSEKGILSPSLAMSVVEGRRRSAAGRESLQPSDVVQPLTNEVANYLTRQLEDRLASIDPSQIGQREGRAAQYRVERWCTWAAATPSPVVVPAVKKALGAGVLGIYATSSALNSLLRLGTSIREREGIAHVESLVNTKAATWLHESDKYQVGELASFLVCTVPDAQLSQPWTHYLDIWRKCGYHHAIISACQTGGCIRAWDILEGYLKSPGEARGSAADAMIKIVDAQTIPRFLMHLRSGDLFAAQGSIWRLEQLAPHVAAVLRGNPALIRDFIAACRGSPRSEADTYLIQVLSRLGYSVQAMSEYLLESLDAGRITNMHSPGVHAMESLLIAKREIGVNTFETSPAACVGLRSGLYKRARTSGAVAVLARRILARLEAERRESGRPDDEPRHPNPSDESGDWIETLLLV